MVVNSLFKKALFLWRGGMGPLRFPWTHSKNWWISQREQSLPTNIQSRWGGCPAHFKKKSCKNCLQFMYIIYIDLEPETSTLKWLFQWDDSRSLHGKWHQRSIKQMLFRLEFQVTYFPQLLCERLTKNYPPANQHILYQPELLSRWFSFSPGYVSSSEDTVDRKNPALVDR